MKRRDFLAATGAGGLAGLTMAQGPAVRAKALTQDTLADASWRDIKAQFDPAPGISQMSAFYLASHPKPVREAIARHRLGLDQNSHGYIHDMMAPCERGLRDAAAEFMGCEADHIAQVGSTTAGLGLTLSNIPVGKDFEILTDTRDHIVTQISTMYASQRGGAGLRREPLYDSSRNATKDEVVANVRKQLKDNTRLFAMTWVHSGTGVKMPVEAIGEVVAKHNHGKSDEARTLFAVDGVHGFGNQDIDIPDLGADFFIAGTHKWIYGPRGTGIVWARPEAQAFVQASIPTFDPSWRKMPPMEMPIAAHHTPGGFHAFEHTWAVEDAFRFCSSIGRARIADRIASLASTTKEQLGKLPKVTLATPDAQDMSAGIICFDVEGWDPYEGVDKLHEAGIIASVVPGFYRPLHMRVAPSLMTDEADVERTVRAIAAL
ncbi:aminotransferase class V-fold PLP-dependent enzyme [Qipengyuania sp. 1NDH17]|uniref:Aminotransferase class V-fold PLP-dependent enzyme n=1 Tax=Qipengyuania polymorpha TaxID=2867234 RepID=A0ABS7IU13_9SPHN|nr:aminotransferase class V-fold PLP-dependent enzyme [Qipengyuania polymorpha]MBX7456859.1 aminotransferase class V-fold PLP-dependent enzyme [Qipengyuania polymorpha]